MMTCSPPLHTDPLDLRAEFLRKGWCRFPFDPLLMEWVERTLPAARVAVHAPEQAKWLRCGGTWFVGVNALPNDALGAVPDGLALQGTALTFIKEGLELGNFDLDCAQLSICYPGYPQPWEGESETALHYRRARDAAHIDGLLPEGDRRRRHLREHHGFILGIPMVDTPPRASPFVVWEGSHEIVRETFSEFFAGTAPDSWGDLDLTDTYHRLRRTIFDSCDRIEVPARPGEAYLAHRLTLHGMAPWGANAGRHSEGRMVCYFRPEIGGAENWLQDP